MSDFESAEIAELIRAQVLTIQRLLSELPLLLQQQAQQVVIRDQQALLDRFEQAATRIQAAFDRLEPRLQRLEHRSLPLTRSDIEHLITVFWATVEEVDQLKAWREAHAPSEQEAGL